MSSEAATPASKIVSQLGDGRALEVEFTWQIDRYAHTILLTDQEARATIYSSVEGTSDEVWPSSPALQQLSIENRTQGKDVALLVGMAGKNHYSAAIEVVPAKGRIYFDIACRSTQTPAWLGSTYRCCSSESSLCLQAAKESQVLREKELVRISQTAPQAPPATWRWQYEIAVANKKRI